MKKGLSGRVWLSVILFGLFGQLAWMVENMYFNVFVYNTISTDPAVIANMVAASAVTATATTLVMGAVSDKLGKRKALIVGGYIIWGLTTAAFGLITVENAAAIAGTANAVALAATLVVVMDCVMTFFGSTANDAAYNAWLNDATAPEVRGRVESVVAILPLVALLIIFGTMDGLTQAGRWDVFFYIIGGLVTLGGLLGIGLLQDKPGLAPSKERFWQNFLYGFRPGVVKANGALYMALLALLVFNSGYQIFMPYLIIYIQNYLGIADYALILGVVLIAASVISVLGGRLIDRAGKTAFLLPAIGVELIGLIGMWLVRGMAGVMLFGILMLGGSMLVTACIVGIVRDLTPEGKAGHFQGIRMIFYVMFPMIIGPYIGAAVIRGSGMTYIELGEVKQVPTPAIFLASAIALLVLVLPVLWLIKRLGRGVTSGEEG